MLVGDGLIRATVAGSSDHNLFADGPIVTLGLGLLAVTPIGPSCLVDVRCVRPGTPWITPKNLDSCTRPATADIHERFDILTVTVQQKARVPCRGCSIRIMGEEGLMARQVPQAVSVRRDSVLRLSAVRNGRSSSVTLRQPDESTRLQVNPVRSDGVARV